MPESNEPPITKQDLMEMKAGISQDLIEMEARLEQRLLDRVQEMVRDAQTEILRGFERFSRAQDIRLRKIEADYSNLNTSETIRIGMLEERVTSIEQKLIGGISPHPPH